MRLMVSTYQLEILLACWLGLLQELTRAYTVESLTRACGHGFATRRQIRLSSGGPSSAVSLVLDEGDRGAAPKHCGVDVHAPDSRILSVQLVRTVPTPARSSDTYRSPCPLAVFSLTRVGRSPRRHLRSIDLCDEEAVFNFSAVFPRQHISLVWMPPFGNFSHRLQASEIVVTAVGNGPGVCKTASYRGLFPCWRRSLCVSLDLVCDGRPNCPDGDDEDPQLCVFSPSQTPTEKPRHTTTHTRATQNNQILVNSTAVEDSTSLPAALSQYGPWGFVMLGMLICGSVLMLCGIWECCCRRSKTPSVPAPATPSVFVIGSSVQPEGAAPPSYDDLDQPPAYNTLFPPVASKESSTSNRY